MSIWQVTQLTFHPSEHSEGVSPWHVFKLPNAMWPIFTTYIILCNHYHSLNRNRMPWCLMCRALHRHHAACPVALVPIYLCCWPSSWPSICKLDGSPSGQSTSEHWKSRKSQEILQRALSYYEWRGYIIKKCLCFGGLHILQTLESICEWIREQGFCMIDPPEKLVACIEYVMSICGSVSHFRDIQVGKGHVSISYIILGPCPNMPKSLQVSLVGRLPAWSSTRTLFTLNCFAEPAIGRAGKRKSL